MSFFSVLGKIGKSIGKTVLNVGGGVIGDNTLGSDIFGSSNGTPTAKPAVLNNGTGGGSNAVTNSQGVASAQPNWLSYLPQIVSDVNKLHPTVNTKIDASAVPGQLKSAMPVWVLPVGIGVALIMLLKNSGGRR